MRLLSLFILGIIFLSACTGSTGEQTEASTQTEEPVVEAKKYTITPFTPSPSFPDAKIESMTYEGGKMDFGIGGATYKLGVQTADAATKMCANSGKGQHIHLIVDNKPYAAKYEASFDYEIENGDHYILAFLSRSYHESIKTTDASTVKKVNVEDGKFTSSEDVTEPMLFYSRPKGTYVGENDTKKVMLDFYLANLDLGTDYKVKAEINGEAHMIEQWQPYFVEGMPMGENTIKLTLLDKDGNVVDTPLNPVERTFTLKADNAPTE